LDTGADIGCGRALARNGAVTMDTNDVSINTAGCEATTSGGGGGGGGTTVPEPSTGSLLLLIGAPGLLGLHKLKLRRLKLRKSKLARP
jgi:hypothetical protein